MKYARDLKIFLDAKRRRVDKRVQVSQLCVDEAFQQLKAPQAIILAN
jgi:hypothetical protein